MYNKELVWIFQILLLLHDTTSVSTSNQNAPPQVTRSAKGMSNSNAHIIHNHDITRDYSHRENVHTTVFHEFVHPTEDGTPRETIDDSQTIHLLDKDAENFVEEPGKSEEGSILSGNLGHFDACNNHGSCYRHGSDFSCCCRPGYTGPQCELDIFTPSTESSDTVETIPTKTTSTETSSFATRLDDESRAPKTHLPCQPVNNCSAHYTCGDNGSRTCLQGWDGDDCDQLIPNSEADCTVYNYENDFINSHWNGTFDCRNDTLMSYTLIISVSGADLVGTFTTDQFSVVIAGQYVAFTKFLLLASDKSDKISWNNYSGISLNMKLNSNFDLTGSVHFSGNSGSKDCKSNLHRTSAYFDGCSFHGDCYRYGRNKNDFHCCCEQGFHGLFCEKNTTITPSVATTSCVPVNNCSAHYTCNSDGSKQCLQGWRGENCDEMIPDSVADCSYYDFKDCLDPPLKPNATARYQIQNGMKHAIISCTNETGYLVKDELDCKNGNWSIYALPQCLSAYRLVTQGPTVYRPTLLPFPHSLRCPSINSIENGKVIPTSLVVSFTCDDRYHLLGSSSLGCLNGNWNDTAPICSNCGPLNNLQHGKIEYSVGEAFTIANFSCLDGYDLRGEAVSNCLNGIWSHVTPVCILSALSCNPLPQIENGLIVMEGLSNGSSAVYVCNEGYNIVGVVVRYCVNGSWIDEEPFCRITDCGTPLSPENGEVTTLGGTTYGSLTVYTCNLGYYTNGTKSRVCQENGSWSNTVPTCHVVDCGNLTDPVNGLVEYENASDSRTGYKSIAAYSCSPGFSLVGFTSRICLAIGKWSGMQPRCVKSTPNVKPCPRHIDNWGTTWDSALPGQTSAKQCRGENNIGEITRQCSLAGEWDLPLYNCVRRDIANVKQQLEELHNNPSSAGVTHTLDQLASVTTSVDDGGELHAGELESITDSLDLIASISESGMLVTEEQSQAYIKTASNMFDQRNAQSWQALSQTQDVKGASRVLQSLDRFSGAITRALEQGNKSQISLIQSNIVMQVKKISRDQQNIAFPDSSNKPDWLRDSKTGFNLSLQSNAVRSYTGVFYRDLVSIFPNRSLSNSNDSHFDNNNTLNSPVLSLQLFPYLPNLSLPLELTFNHQNPNFRNASCSYWNFDSNLWETEGCHVKTSNEDVTVCQCYHLTNFAVLMSPWNTESEVSTIIEVISIVGCSVSIVCLLITLSAHMVVWRYVRSDRVVILMNLCLALTVSYIIFLAGVNQTQNKDACTAVAALLQYIYLVVFFLMLAEGIEIAVTVLYVFSTKSRIKWILPAAWGIPAIIVGISLGVTKLEGYGTDDFCWLSVENGLIWAFVGPAVFIILVNVILLTLVLRAMLSSKAVSEKTDKEKLKCSLRCLCVLLPLMGCTWVLGIFYVNERMVWIQYLFAICNSLQGFFIFLFHGFLNKQLRTAIKRRQKKYRDSATTSKELSSKPREPKRDKPLFQADGGSYSEPVHLVSYEKRRSIQTRKITLSFKIN